MNEQIVAYVDGECPMCVAGALRMRRWDRGEHVRFVDVHTADAVARLEHRFSEAERLRLMIAEMPDGTWRIGYFAWAEILWSTPSTRLLGWLMRCPLLYGIGPAVYGWIADHRQLVSRLLRLPPPCDETGACRLNDAAQMRQMTPALFGRPQH